MTQKNVSKTFDRLWIAVNVAIYWIFEVKKIRPQNIAIKWQKNGIFFYGPKPIQAGH